MTPKPPHTSHVYTLKSYVILAVLTALLCVLVSASGVMGMTIVSSPAASPSEATLAQTTPQGTLQQGRSLYEAGQFAAAAEILEQAVESYRTQGDATSEAIALANLSLVYQQLGQWTEAETAIATSLERLRSSNSTNRLTTEAQILDVQGRLQLAQGQADNALNTWERVEALYDQANDSTGVVRATINQAEALQTLGLYRRAIATLEELTTIDQPDSTEQVVALRSLGDALRVTGDLETSQQVLERSLAVAERLQLPSAMQSNSPSREIAQTRFSLGNTAYAQAQRQGERARTARRRGDVAEAEETLALQQQRQAEALRFYQQVAPDGSLTVQTQALLNQLRLLIEAQRWAEAEALVPQITTQLDRLPPSRTVVYARVNFAQSLIQLENRDSTVSRSPDVLPLVRPPESTTRATAEMAAQQLAIAVRQAQALRDPRAQAFAFGNLGSLYEKTEQFSEAQRLSAQALALSQQSSASDVSYLWQWQLGRILKAQGDRKGAIAAYSDAVTTLQSLRSDLVAVSLEVQFSFRETIEPIHRELVSLLLQPDVEPTQAELEQARKTIESLQLAELDNFFREACLNARQVDIDQVDRLAAVIYPIILSDRIEVILSLPAATQASADSQAKQTSEAPAAPLRHYSTPIPASQVESTVGNLRQFLRQATAARRAQPLAEEVYDWLIRPVADELKASGARTLVFVPDGVLRNIPMSALFDGEKFLIEDYAVALTPGLQLLEAQSIQSQQLSVLLAGVSEAQQNFPELPGVINEFEAISTKVPASQVLLNQDFTTTNFQTAINQVPYPIVHLATHGEFSSQPEETFILTWQNRIDIQQLSSLLQATDVSRRRPIELLVLSACKTAEGDDRAALGLAGVAVRAGARSTVATLWSFDDQAASLIMDRFYQELATSQVTKAEALRRAQLTLLQDPQYRRPYFWSPVVLVGNWQ